MGVFNWSDYTIGRMGLDLLGNSIRKGIEYDYFGAKNTFVAVALTDLFPLSSVQAMGIDGASTALEGNGNPRYAFRGRILGRNSPHSFIPDPCDPARAGTNPESKAQNWILIQMHTLFLTTNADVGLTVTRGDKVHVQLDHPPTPPWRYNLEFGKILGVAAHEDPATNARGPCTSLNDLFGIIARGGNGAPIGTGPNLSNLVPGTGASVLRTTGLGTDINNDQITPFYTFPGGDQALGTLSTEGRQDLEAFLQAMKTAGFTYSITSPRRSVKHQYNILMTSRGPVAAPCLSDHQYGDALDIVFWHTQHHPTETKSEKHVSGPGHPAAVYIPFIENHVLPIAKLHNVKWEGPGDAVHWSSTTAGANTPATKLKCVEYYYTLDYSSSDPTWPAPLKWPSSHRDASKRGVAMTAAEIIANPLLAKAYAKTWPGGFTEDLDQIEP